MSSGNDQSRSNNVHSLEVQSRRSQQIDRIEKYWNKVRGKRLVPSRSEIDPRGLEGVLGNAFILERITGGLARFRIAGSHLTDLTGLELRQMPVSALFLPGSREILSEALTSTFDDPAVVRMSLVSPAGFGREHLNGEMIFLPLRSDLGDIDRVLGGMIFDGKIGRTPRRIDIASQTRQSLVGYAGTNPTVSDAIAQPKLLKPRRITGPRATETPHIKRGHLRLVVSND